MKKVLAVIGARPQFIKHYPLECAAKGKLDLVTVHTGQHYDENMSKVFFDQLGMRKPDYMLSLGGGNHGVQTGRMMIELEEIVLKENPDYILVYGDTNSTLAGALVGAKLHKRIVHVEAGLRSFNKHMPEEINRVLTDHISDLLLVPSSVSLENLKLEGITDGVSIVGDIMKDMVLQSVEKMECQPKSSEDYFYVTLHRPYNVDEKDRLVYVLDSLSAIGKKLIFAIHPRTRAKMKTFDIDMKKYGDIDFIDPQPYFENLCYLQNSIGLITDSGGMQKEAYWMRKPCITIRSETEWKETLVDDMNVLVFDDLSKLASLTHRNLGAFDSTLYGEGNTGERIISTIIND